MKKGKCFKSTSALSRPLRTIACAGALLLCKLAWYGAKIDVDEIPLLIEN